MASKLLLIPITQLNSIFQFLFYRPIKPLCCVGSRYFLKKTWCLWSLKFTIEKWKIKDHLILIVLTPFLARPSVKNWFSNFKLWLPGPTTFLSSGVLNDPWKFSKSNLSFPPGGVTQIHLLCLLPPLFSHHWWSQNGFHEWQFFWNCRQTAENWKNLPLFKAIFVLTTHGLGRIVIEI